MKSYIENDLDLAQLKALPLAIAGWMRYLLAFNDNLEPIELSSDPLKEELQSALAGIELGNTASYNGQLKSILCNVSIFGLDLVSCGLSDTIENYFVQLISEKGAVRKTLHSVLNN